ncbi:nucleoside-diphosphate sugar epimerase/dehydratase [uncultured Sphaerochaeta sp.]|uniref:nucleoside-diphosphate sugar epimerase/dehydratase n=1 Tax=uncultured Sphaerochaeta sp. TaxID=886478 RepID=UPI002A0A298F|nr:nucleoside-diphosphate sugar epimerase/dehydratase [uncultured Sphaerochaeta sp.]
MVNRRIRQALLMVFDALILFACGLLSSWIVLHSLSDPFLKIVLANGFSMLLVLFAVRFYRIRISESSLDLLSRGLLGFVPVCIIGIFLVAIFYSFASVWIPFLLVMDGSAFLFMMGSRVAYRTFLYRRNMHWSHGLPRAVIYGAGELGSTIVRQFRKGKGLHYITGFVDDDPALQGSYIVGTKVLGSSDNLNTILQEQRAEVLIIAISQIDREHMFKAVDAAKECGCEIKVIPNLFEVQQGAKEFDLRTLDYADLLGRPLTYIDREPIAAMVKGKKVLVTGAGGSIGSEICRQLLGYGPEQLILLDIDETDLHNLSLSLHNYQKEWSDLIVPVICDIKNAKKIDMVYTKFQPQLVFHAAAYKHVPLQELYPEEAITTNLGGSYNVLKSARDHKVEKVVVISTDKAVNPTNVMGATKRVVEKIASMLTTDETPMVCVRFGNVIGSRGSMLPLFMDQIKAGVPLTVTHKDIIRYFMAIPEAVGLVFKAASMAKGGEVMVLDMGQPVKIYDFAQKLIKYYGDGRSQVIVTGLRPGEKLFEELMASKDTTIPTEDKLVFKAKLENHVLTPEAFQPIYDALYDDSTETLLEELQQLVPEFTYEKCKAMF